MKLQCHRSHLRKLLYLYTLIRFEQLFGYKMYVRSSFLVECYIKTQRLYLLSSGFKFLLFVHLYE